MYPRYARADLLPGGTQPSRFSQTGQRVFGDQLQRIRRAIFHTGRTLFTSLTQIAFMRAGFELVWRDGRQYHLHGAEWAGDDAGFTADTLLRIDLHAVVNMRDCAVRTATGAGRIFAMVTCNRAALALMFDDSNSGLIALWRQDMSLIIVSHYAGDLAGMAAQTLLAIGHNKTIHGILLFWL